MGLRYFTCAVERDKISFVFSMLYLSSVAIVTRVTPYCNRNTSTLELNEYLRKYLINFVLLLIVTKVLEDEIDYNCVNNLLLKIVCI